MLDWVVKPQVEVPTRLKVTVTAVVDPRRNEQEAPEQEEALPVPDMLAVDPGLGVAIHTIEVPEEKLLVPMLQFVLPARDPLPMPVTDTVIE